MSLMCKQKVAIFSKVKSEKATTYWMHEFSSIDIFFIYVYAQVTLLCKVSKSINHLVHKQQVIDY